jgi:rod shape-determining protein MreB
MFSGFFQPKDIAIDLGTCNTLVYVRGQGIVLDEPSVVAIRSEGGPLGKKSLQAVGRDAKAMLGKVPGHLNAIRPMRGGVIADFALTELMLKEFIRKVRPSKGFFGSLPRMVICVPCGSTQVERRAIRESALATGAKQVFLLEEPIAAAFGAGMPVTEATGSMVVVIGGGSTEVAVISLGGMVYKSSLRVGGDKFDDAIIAHVRRHHGVLIGEHTAENIKIAVGSALPTKQVLQMEVNGRHMALGVPRSFTINSNEVTQALTEPLGQIIEAVRNALESTPPELGADIANKGMVLAGGGALLRDLDKLLSDAIGVPVFIAPEPLTCVARGCGMTLERLDDPAKLFS